MLRIPNPVATPCPECAEPTVLAEFATGPVRVHCGTYAASCDRPTDIRRTSAARQHRKLQTAA